MNLYVEIIAIIVAVMGVIVSALIYAHTVRRERKLDTMREFSRIREKFPEVLQLDSQEKEIMQYLTEMERFCTGVNLNLYDWKIINKMSGNRLISQYRGFTKEFIKSRPDLSDGSRPYSEYTTLMEKLIEKRCNK